MGAAAKEQTKRKVKPATVDANGIWQLIARKAYELYEQRGGGEGQAMGDWLEAERIVMDELHESRE